jgi:DNA-binding transcriptional ArsR family regulator
VTDRPHRGAIDYERLGQYMRALSVPTRILLLQKVQLPHTASEVKLPPFRRDAALRADRSLSRQAVEGHLRKLEEAGLVRSRPTEREGQPTREFLVNQERLFTLVEDVRRLALIRASSPGPQAAATAPRTMEADAELQQVATLPEGPALVLVSGPYEGKCFPLALHGPWAIGRSKDAQVPIDYDPFLSAHNTEILREGGRFLARTLPASRNGTTVNWRLLRRGEAAPLRAGDTLGVGRSLLVARGL